LGGGDANSHGPIVRRRKKDAGRSDHAGNRRNAAGDESQFSRELDARLRERFPVGTAQDKLIGYLVGANFVPDWPRRDANVSLFIFNGWLCDRIVHVLWRADAAGTLTNVSGAYESHCL
jgi:hypothetical protein